MRRQGIPGSALKWAAMASMLIDHFAYVFYPGSAQAGRPLFSFPVYLTLRCVGRLAFPIYCFLLVEGFRYTRSVKNYLLRLLAFGLVSELPFDLAFRRAWADWNYQNVYFTLLLGLLSIWLWERITQGDPAACGWRRVLLGLVAITGLAAAAELARTDYGAWGVAVIAATHLFRRSEWQRDLFSGCALLLSSPLEVFAFLAFVPMHAYNGERGRQPKYLFYVFYPGHLLTLALVCRLIYG